VDRAPAARHPPVVFIPYRVENLRILVVLAGMPRGQHKVLIELVDAEGNVFTAQTVTFQSPGKEARP